MKLKSSILALAAASLGICASSAQTTLGVGDIGITGFNSNAPDGFTFVLYKAVAAGTLIKFTDNGFLSSASANSTSNGRGGENFVSWTAPTGGLSAGSVVRIVNVSGSSNTVTGGGTTTLGLNGISSSGDQIFAYQGAGTGASTSTSDFGTNVNPSTFTGTALFGVNFQSAWLTTGTVASTTSYLPSELSGANANIALSGTGTISGQYTGVRTGLTSSLYSFAVANATNWTTNIGSGNETLSTTNFTAAASASIFWDANGSSVNNGGTGTWDTTTNDRFKDSAAGTTFTRWVNSSTGNDHTAVFGGTAGTVSLGSGGVTASGLQFDATGYAIQSNTLTLAGATPTISVTTAEQSATISSTLAGSTGLTKSGAGLLILTGTNSTNIGATRVTAGTLVVGVGGTGSLTSAVTVTNAGSTLGGSGTITGNVTINNEAILAPGNSPGVMTVAGTTTLDAGSIFSWELNSDVDHDGIATDGTRGTNYDGLTSTNLAVASGAIFRVVLAGASGDLSSGFWDQNQSWNNIFSISGTTTNAATGQLFNAFEVYNGTTNVTLATASQGSFSFNNSTLVWSAVPEPTSALAGLLLGAGLLRRRRGV